MRHKLDNGLTILLKENRSAKVIAFQAWIQAGSGDESEHESGLAHLHEHMLFKGTTSRGVGEIARDVEAAGGDINASTSHDQTIYHLVMPSRDLGLGVEILADVLRRSTFEEEELRKEKDVVLEEIKRSEDMPGSRLSRRLFDLAYTVHPYKRPVLGTALTVSGFTRDDLMRFYRRHYRPQKTTLVLVGDFAEVEALELIKNLFEDWSPALMPGESEKRSPRCLEPPMMSSRVCVMQQEVKESHFALAWPVPNIGHQDIPSLDVLSVVLGNGESSRLITALQRRKHVVNMANAYVYSPRDPGLFVVGGQAPAKGGREALESVLDETYRFRSELITQEELMKAKTIIESDRVYQAQTVQGQARWLGFFECTAGAVEFESVFYRRAADVSAEDVRRVANVYLTNNRLVATAIVPKGSSLDESCAKRIIVSSEEKAKEAISKTSIRSGTVGADKEHLEILRVTLNSGATLLVQRDPAVSLVAMRAAFVGGQLYENERNSGISALASALLTRGTATKSADDIAAMVDGWAGSLNGYSGMNSFGMEAEVLARNFNPTLSLMFECLNQSVFPERDLESEKALILEEISSKEDYPSEVAFGLFRKTLWRAHPYRMDLNGTRESIGTLDRDRISRYVQEACPPSGMHLAVVGSVDPEEVVKLAESRFGRECPALSSSNLPMQPAHEPTESGPRFAEKKLSKEQSHIVLGFPGVTLSDPERYTLQLISSILSGQGGRLFVELRDRRSMAYSVGSYSQEGIHPGFFCVYIGCSPEKASDATDAIRVELARVRNEKVSLTELERAKRYLIGSHEIGLQRAASRAAVLAFSDAYGVGYLSHAKYAESIESVNSEMILDVAARFLNPDYEVLVQVGPTLIRRSSDAQGDRDS